MAYPGTVPKHCGILVCLLLLSGLGAKAADAPDKGDEIGLFSDDKKELLEYVQKNRIPNARYLETWPTGAPLEVAFAHAARQVKRAADMFVKGDSEFRLAIARAMVVFFNEAGRMWDACGEDDYEARHWLLLGLLAPHGYTPTPDPKRGAEARKWLLNEAHPSLAEPILRALCNRSARWVYEELSADEQQKMLALMRKLYGQKGEMVCFAPCPELEEAFPGDSGPIQKYVIRALGNLRSAAAQEQLIEWMIEDGKKADPSVRGEMWQALGAMTWEKLLIPRDRINEIAGRTAMAELLVLPIAKRPKDPRAKGGDQVFSGYCLVSGTGKHGDATTRKVFRANLLDQLANPDREVVQGLANYLVCRYDDKDRMDWLPQVEKVKLTSTANKRAKECLQKAFADYPHRTDVPESEAKRRKQRFATYRVELMKRFE